MNFKLHPQLAADTEDLGALELCRVLLMRDANFPWLILVPQRESIQEIYQLNQEDQQLLLHESSIIGKAMMELFVGDKLNIAALGNVVPQLHLHHVVRYKKDVAWPSPVWGCVPRREYEPAAMQNIQEKIKIKIQLIG